MRKCIWIKSIKRRILISVFNYWLGFSIHKFKSGSITFLFGWVNLYYCSQIIELEVKEEG